MKRIQESLKQSTVKATDNVRKIITQMSGLETRVDNSGLDKIGGKQVDLVTEGAETEIDKTVLDQLADPLIHLIRNSLDHGIESPVDRARGTPPSVCLAFALAPIYVVASLSLMASQ